MALIAYCIPKLARAYGRDPGAAFTVALLNPLTLLALIGGAHNDAIMVGLLLAGVTAAKYRHPVVGIVLCTLAAAIKVPAAIGIVYVAWDWAGPGVAWRERVRPLVKGGAHLPRRHGAACRSSPVSAGVGSPTWAHRTPSARGWPRPPPSAWCLSGALHVLHIGVGLGGVLTVTRLLGLLAATAIAVYCLRHKESLGLLTALGITVLVFVLLGPVVQPWYLTWGIILMAPVIIGRLRSLALVLSIVAPFIGLTGGASLLKQLLATNPLEHGVGRVRPLGYRHAPARTVDHLVASRPGPPGVGPA